MSDEKSQTFRRTAERTCHIESFHIAFRRISPNYMTYYKPHDIIPYHHKCHLNPGITSYHIRCISHDLIIWRRHITRIVRYHIASHNISSYDMISHHVQYDHTNDQPTSSSTVFSLSAMHPSTPIRGYPGSLVPSFFAFRFRKLKYFNLWYIFISAFSLEY